MIKNYVPAEWKESVEYSLEFTYDDNGGFSFPCDASGNVLPMTECAKQNYETCLAHQEEFKRFNEFLVRRIRYREPAHGTCSCGTEVELYDQYYGACECPKCGRWYNLFGQSLLPPDQWETDPSEEEYW